MLRFLEDLEHLFAPEGSREPRVQYLVAGDGHREPHAVFFGGLAGGYAGGIPRLGQHDVKAVVPHELAHLEVVVNALQEMVLDVPYPEDPEWKRSVDLKAISPARLKRRHHAHFMAEPLEAGGHLICHCRDAPVPWWEIRGSYQYLHPSA